MRHSSQADFDVVSGPAPGRPSPAAKALGPADSAGGEHDAAPPGATAKGEAKPVPR